MILGIYHPAHGVGHDTGVALVTEEGRVVAALSEERVSRVKMDGGFPFRAFDTLQRMTGFTARDLSAVAVPFCSPTWQVGEGVRLLAAGIREPQLLARQIENRRHGDRFQAGITALGAYEYLEGFKTRVRNVRVADGRPELHGWRDFLEHYKLGHLPVVRVDHHLAHAAGAYYTSGWEDALVVTCDGVGALKSSCVCVARRGRLRIIERTFYPHSPGQFWELVTVLCGFHHMKHGGKITGLAAHGDRNAPCYAVMRDAIAVDGLRIRAAMNPVQMAERLRGVSREDIAATAQRRLEEVVTELIARAVSRTGIRRVALSGGVFGNVRLNQCIAELDGVDEIYVYPAMGDEGLGLGCALFAAAQRERLTPFRLDDVYFGPEYSEYDITAALARAGVNFTRLDDRELADRTARLLAAGDVVALFRGRMEFGPRALGHRTVMFHTEDATVNDWLNKRLHRTEFMPFAPVTLAEHAERCYTGLRSRWYATKFMTVTCDCTVWMKRVSPAVVHLDGTARPQIVTGAEEPFYYDLLRRYHERTGIPSLINTSFNMHEEPIVCSPDDAVRAFQLGDLDHLVIGSYLASADKKPSAPRPTRARDSELVPVVREPVTR